MSNTNDLRFIRTNQLLVSAFTELLSRKKFEEITINELCEKALVRRATFYSHFMDKYDFFSYFINSQRKILMEGLSKEQTPPDPDEYYLYMSRQLCHYLFEHKTIVKNVMDSNAFPLLLCIFSEQMSQGLYNVLKASKAENNEHNISTEFLASFYAGGLIHVVGNWISDSKKISEEELMKEVSLLLKSHPIFPQKT